MYLIKRSQYVKWLVNTGTLNYSQILYTLPQSSAACYIMYTDGVRCQCSGELFNYNISVMVQHRYKEMYNKWGGLHVYTFGYISMTEMNYELFFESYLMGARIVHSNMVKSVSSRHFCKKKYICVCRYLQYKRKQTI